MNMQNNEPENSSGIGFTQTEGQLTPRSTAAESSEPAPPGQPATGKPQETAKTIKISSAAVKLPLLSISRAVAEGTGYEKFAFNTEEADTLAQAIVDLGVEVSPLVNVLLLAAGIVGVKAAGYAWWLKAGKPGANGSGQRQAPEIDEPDPPMGDGEFEPADGDVFGANDANSNGTTNDTLQFMLDLAY